MAKIVLFHSVLGVRPGVLDAAARMEAMGHTVHVPNLYEDGKVFDDYTAASAYVDALGYPALVERTRAAVKALPANLVYAGFSNGGASAEYLAAMRPGAAGALLFAAAIPLTVFAQVDATAAINGWPASVPVDVHYMTSDPFRDNASVESLQESVRASGAEFTLYDYPGSGHLFTDASLPAEYDEAASALLWQRVESFLAAV